MSRGPRRRGRRLDDYGCRDDPTREREGADEARFRINAMRWAQ